jgi:hypothetical protein
LQKSQFLDEEFAVDASKLVSVGLGGADVEEMIGGPAYKKIVVKQVYPLAVSGECSAENYPDCDTYLVYDNSQKKISGAGGGKTSEVIISVPVPLYFPETDSYKAGRMDLTWYP